VSAVFEVLNGVPVIVERAMYLNQPGRVFDAGHESAGVTAPATGWFLAEGATGPYFDLFVLIANPTGADASITVTFLLPNGNTVIQSYTVAANSRFNIWVDTLPGIENTAVATIVESTIPIIVERAMWWPGTAATWAEAHNSPGLTATGRWALADGEVGGSRGVETYILGDRAYIMYPAPQNQYQRPTAFLVTRVGTYMLGVVLSAAGKDATAQSIQPAAVEIAKAAIATLRSGTK
jgi:hypothetical protein